MTRFYSKCGALLFIVLIFTLFNFPLYALTPRLLITLGPECDFSAQELAHNLKARVINGSEQKMQTEIDESDLLDLTHLIVLDSPVENLSKFASKVFYDHIEIDDKWEIALAVLKGKISEVPLTDADLKKISREERGRFYHLLTKVSEILHDHQIPFWAISGTLLGAVRHGGMVPWDDDLDIIIRIKEKAQFESLADLLNDSGLELFTYHNYFYKIFPKKANPSI